MQLSEGGVRNVGLKNNRLIQPLLAKSFEGRAPHLWLNSLFNHYRGNAHPRSSFLNARFVGGSYRSCYYPSRYNERVIEAAFLAALSSSLRLEALTSSSRFPSRGLLYQFAFTCIPSGYPLAGVLRRPPPAPVWTCLCPLEGALLTGTRLNQSSLPPGVPGRRLGRPS